MRPNRYPYNRKPKRSNREVVVEIATPYLEYVSEIAKKEADPYYPPLLKNEKLKREKKDLEKETIKRFLEFRKKFTKRQWADLETAINARFSEKAGQLKLDDFDLKAITERLERYL